MRTYHLRKAWRCEGREGRCWHRIPECATARGSVSGLNRLSLGEVAYQDEVRKLVREQDCERLGLGSSREDGGDGVGELGGSAARGEQAAEEGGPLSGAGVERRGSGARALAEDLVDEAWPPSSACE